MELLKINQEERAKEYRKLGLKQKEVEELNQREIDEVKKKYKDKEDAETERKKKEQESLDKERLERPTIVGDSPVCEKERVVLS